MKCDLPRYMTEAECEDLGYEHGNADREAGKMGAPDPNWVEAVSKSFGDAFANAYKQGYADAFP